ncbi:MAG TPA: shikimate dehydrogenase [Candidatus Dormibacteraeota bacterium]|nr:shikimate dehydrogenase [Candidatus Dormibacteraeota bacterium]
MNEHRFLVGLVGAGIGSSLSPLLHEREADAQGLRYLYQLIDIEHLGLDAEAIGDLLAAARLMGYRGLNITHPCKRAVIRHLDELSPEVAALGAANTVVFDAGRAIGHNTDRYGFERSFATRLPDVATERVVLLGAGGAGAAVAHAMLALGAGQVAVADLDPDRAIELVAALRARFGPDRAVPVEPGQLAARVAQADGVINATPVGMVSRPGLPLPPELLRPGLWVADIVYRPLETELLAAARKVGCRTLDGAGMALFQAAESFRIFTGLQPDIARMTRHLEQLTTIGEVEPTCGHRSPPSR